ncbi:hypothetical protein [Kitasatospora sp. NE20-6]|uniref:hypothetical protein n=1 Tax=Kitasatospora sp. NE20-6 TaxID=2859066 RepID=UPI0038B3382D
MSQEHPTTNGTCAIHPGQRVPGPDPSAAHRIADGLTTRGCVIVELPPRCRHHHTRSVLQENSWHTPTASH